MLNLFADAAWKVLAVSLVIGAGLPALFAGGVRAMAYGVGGDAEDNHQSGHPVGKVIGYLIFALVLFFIGLGITIVVASGLGKEVSFQHLYPMIVDKKK